MGYPRVEQGLSIYTVFARPEDGTFLSPRHKNVAYGDNIDRENRGWPLLQAISIQWHLRETGR
ncbi:protein of unknown function (plasmid) [Shinella sp. WSC3-e]|nr:protein of unknown function [Shinella sp. WSC3-e]